MSRSKIKNTISKFIISVILIVGVFLYTTYLEKPINDLLNKKNIIDQPDSTTRIVDSDLSVYFVDVGQADCIMISNNGHYMLIDAGNNADGAKLVNYFKSMGVEKFDYVIGTHAHEDHIGGMDDIINNFSIGTFYMPDAVSTSKTFEEVLEALENKNIKFNVPVKDNNFDFNDALFKILYVGTDESDLNDTSIVLKMEYGKNSFLFTGDASSSVEKEILDKDINVDVLKVGHHGSQYSSSLKFLEKVNPKYAIIQVGTNNIYDHPKDIILKRLEKLDVKIYRTDLDGTIIAKSNGEKLTFTTMETDTNG